MAVVLKEIERQRNLRAFDAIAPDTTTLNKKLRRTSLVMSKIEPPSTKRCNLGRQISDPNGQSRHRIYSASCPSTDDGKPKLRDPRLTAAADKLSKEEMELLELDILKPLDVDSIVRRQATDCE